MPLTDGGVPRGDDGGSFLLSGDDGGGMMDAISIIPPVNDADMPQTDANPGGPWVAFVSSGLDGFDIYIVHDDGTDLHAVVKEPGNDLGPTWSPDGRKIAFESNHGSEAGATYALYVVDVASGVIAPLPTGLSDAVSPAWSPERHRARSVRRPPAALYLVSADGGSGDPPHHGDVPRQHPRVVARRHDRLLLEQPRDGRHLRRLVGDAGRRRAGAGHDGDGDPRLGPAVSHDGTMLAYAQSGPSGTQVAFFTLATKATEVFTAQGDYEPALAPSGKLLAVTSIKALQRRQPGRGAHGESSRMRRRRFA